MPQRHDVKKAGSGTCPASDEVVIPSEAGFPARTKADMARRIAVTDRNSSAWKSSFRFRLEADTLPEVTALKALGVHYVSMRIGCTYPGEFFTDLIKADPKKGVAIDPIVIWLKQVRDLCESMAPEIIEELWRVAVPDDADPDSNHQEAIAMGNYLLHVDVHCSGEEASVSADFYFPAAEAEVGSLLIRRETRKRPVPPSLGYVTPVVAGLDSTAIEVM